MTNDHAPDHARAASGPAPLAGPRLLVVDDAATVRAYHRSIFAAAGFVVAEAANGYEALERTLIEPFDLLIVDVNMPMMDGYALVEAVRTGTALPDVPIIMISTEGESRDADEAYRRGANLYLVKPADPEQLVLTARMLCGVAAAPVPGGRS